jgi:tetratricopeptide (TPR) repeat protein
METETLQTILNEFEIKGHFSITQVQNFTEKCLQRKNEDDDSDDDSNLSQPSKEDAYKLVNQVLLNPTDGTPGDYHDYAVTFAKAGNYTYACEVLLLGLKKYSTHVDLLSDFLLYATRSSKDEHYELCEEKYEQLKTKRSRWNWRAYDFSIEYLLNKLDRGRGDDEELKAECLELAWEFQANVPENEIGYIDEAAIYSTFREYDKEINALIKAYDRDDILIVRVGISLMQIYVKQKKPEMAMKCMERVMRDIPNADSTISPIRALLLLIIAKTAKLLSGWNVTSAPDAEHNINMALVKEIIADWNRAKNISSTTAGYKDTQGLVEFVKVISGYESIDDEES